MKNYWCGFANGVLCAWAGIAMSQEEYLLAALFFSLALLAIVVNAVI